MPPMSYSSIKRPPSWAAAPDALQLTFNHFLLGAVFAHILKTFDKVADDLLQRQLFVRLGQVRIVLSHSLLFTLRRFLRLALRRIGATKDRETFGPWAHAP